MRNYIKMHTNYIQLSGFEKLSDEITFCLYDGGVVIASKRDVDRNYYHHTIINNERKIEDIWLYENLKKERDYSGEIDFFYTGDSYIEIKPRKKNKK